MTPAVNLWSALLAADREALEAALPNAPRDPALLAHFLAVTATCEGPWEGREEERWAMALRLVRDGFPATPCGDGPQPLAEVWPLSVAAVDDDPLGVGDPWDDATPAQEMAVPAAATELLDRLAQAAGTACDNAPRPTETFAAWARRTPWGRLCQSGEVCAGAVRQALLQGWVTPHVPARGRHWPVDPTRALLEPRTCEPVYPDLLQAALSAGYRPRALLHAVGPLLHPTVHVQVIEALVHAGVNLHERDPRGRHVLESYLEKNPGGLMALLDHDPSLADGVDRHGQPLYPQVLDALSSLGTGGDPFDDREGQAPQHTLDRLRRHRRASRCNEAWAHVPPARSACARI